jgi:F-type H+-transporting ATPase subunit epsilon
MALTLSIYSPERKLVERIPVQQVTLHGAEGQIQILPDHCDMVGSLTPGAFSFTSDTGERTNGFISFGFFDVSGGNLSVVAETLELDTEIDVERAKSAQKRAQDVLSTQELDLDQIEKYQMKLARSLLRQQIASKMH